MELDETKISINQLRLQGTNSGDGKRTVWIAEENYLICKIEAGSSPENGDIIVYVPRANIDIAAAEYEFAQPLTGNTWTT